MSEPLQYEHRSVTAKRKWKRRVIVAAVVTTLSVLAVLRGPAWVRHVQLLYWQHRCMKFSAQGVAFLPEQLPEVPNVEPLAHFLAAAGYIDKPNTIFVHERTSPSRQRRVVWVRASLAAGRLVIHSAAVAPATILSKPTGASIGATYLDIAYDRTTQVFWGQPDPLDSSHFTIEIRSATQRMIVDGWLIDDTVLLEARPPAPIPPPASLPASSR